MEWESKHAPKSTSKMLGASIQIDTIVIKIDRHNHGVTVMIFSSISNL